MYKACTPSLRYPLLRAFLPKRVFKVAPVPKLKQFCSLFLLAALTACSLFKQPDHFESRPVTFVNLTDWPTDNYTQALRSFTASCPVLAKKPRDGSTGSGLEVDGWLWQSLCADAMNVPQGNNDAARLFFERRFTPYRIANNGKEIGLFTGYYVPTLYGSAKRKGRYQYPVYKAPSGLEHKKPYYSHAEIDQGALDGQGLELMWVDDPVMLFFTQIQGSGRVHFEDGSETLIGYAGQNGYEYVSLGKVMGDEGLLPQDQINFYTLRQWLYDHPGRAFSLMERNPSYVFFKKLDHSGVVGAVGAVLAPQRSIAVDSRYIPYGLPVFMETELPALPNATPLLFHRLMIAQDTGGAIHGLVRADIFFGEGSEAEYLAGYMKGHGIYSLLVPNEITNQIRSGQK